MADLEFKRRVQEIPGTPDVPEYQRRENIKIIQNPDIQSAGERNAAATNWMSSLGSEIATRASTALAAKLGSELGSHPDGDSWPSFTEFDKTFEQSYATQAHATLGIQAQKLITKSNIELASYPRLDPNVIARSQKEVQQGLQKIYSLAPESIRPQLEHQYNSVMISQGESLATRMIREQREDRRNNLELSSRLNNENAYSLALKGIDLDKNGDSKAALIALESVEKGYNNALANRDISPLQAKVGIDSARQSYLSGKQIRIALEAERNNKLGEYLKSLADNPPKDIKPEDQVAVFNNVISFMKQQLSLKTMDENLQVQNMTNRIASDPLHISGSEWAAFEATVSPLKAAQTKFKLIQAQKAKGSEDNSVDILLKNYSNPTAQANATPKIRNAAFNRNVQYVMQSNPNMNQDEAEVQVSSSAGAEVPVFTDTLKNKLWSGNPAYMDSAVRQINELKTMRAGHALTGLNQADLALYSQYEALRNPADPTIGARLAIETSQNMDSSVLKVTQSKWADLVYLNTQKSGVNVDDWILDKFGFYKNFSLFSPFASSKTFDSPFMATQYAADILNKYKTNFEYTRGNDVLATKMTNEYIDTNYGETSVNGKKVWTLHPMEKTLGFESNEGVLSIHKDVIRQLEPQLAKLKEAYDNHASNEYWTVEQAIEGKPIQMIKHERAELGNTTKKYNVSFIGSNFNKWDIAIETEYGQRNIFLESPMLGITTYTPDREWILDDYNGRSHIFPKDYISQSIKNVLPSLGLGGE